MKKEGTLTTGFGLLTLCLVILLLVLLYPMIREVIINLEDETKTVAFIQAYGIRGVPILISLAALQVILPLIPAIAVGILSGLCYGIFWGPVIFIVGCVLGNLFLFVFVRRLRRMATLYLKKEMFFNKGSKENKFLSFDRINKMKRPEILAFFCFLIPGFASMVPYVFPQTNISLPKYLLAAVAGSLPFALIYVFLGERISSGNYTTAIIGGVAIVVVIFVLFLLRKKIMAKVLNE